MGPTMTLEEVGTLPPKERFLALVTEKGRRLRILEEREKFRGSLKEYIRGAWQMVEPGTPYVDGWHIDAICEHLEALRTRQIRNLIINIPPRHMKSILCAVMWPTWMWTHTPEFKFLSLSYGAHLSIRDALKSRRLLQSMWYQERWGDAFRLTGDQNAKVRYENDHMGYRIASSVGGLGTGEGGDAIILDDPHNLDEVHSDVIREGVLDWWDQVMSTRLNDPKTGVRLVIMQRGHENDLAGHVIKNRAWDSLILPAEYEGSKKVTVIGWSDPRKVKGELLWPERFGTKELEEIKASLAEYGTASQLQQRPAPIAGGIFRKKWFLLWPNDVKLPVFDYVIQSYDTAYTEKTSSDESACTVWGLFKHPKKRHNCAMLIDAWNERLEYPALRKRVRDDIYARYGGDTENIGAPGRRADVILVEDKGSGITLLQDLRMLGVPAYSYNPAKADKVVRAHAVAPMLFGGRVYLLESGKHKGSYMSWAEAFMHEMLMFPNGSQDNYVDTFTQVFLFLRNKEMLDAKVGGFEEDRNRDEVPGYEEQRVNPYAV